MKTCHFEGIAIRDFMSIQKAEYAFPKGVTLILGDNRDSQAADDNGAGKSSIAEAVRWCLYGETVRNAIDKSLTVQHIIRDGADKASVTLQLEINGTPMLIQRWRSRKTADVTVTFTHNGEKLQGAAARETLETMLGLSVVQFANLVHLDGSYPKLFAPSTDAERKEILGNLVDAPIWEAIQEEVDKRLAPLKSSLDEWEKRQGAWVVAIESSKQQMVEQKDLGRKAALAAKQLEAQLKDQEAILKKINEEHIPLSKQVDVLAQQLADAIKSAKQKQTKAEDVVKQIKYDERELTDSYLAVEISKTQSKLNSLTQELKICNHDIDERLGLQKAGKCPTCGQDTTKVGETDIDALLVRGEELTDEITTVGDTLEEYQKKRKEAINDKRQELQEAETVRAKAISEVTAIYDKDAVVRKDLEGKLKVQSRQLTEAEKTIASLKAQRKAQLDLVDQAKQKWEKASDAHKQGVAYIAEQEAKSEEIKQQKVALDFWKKGFGPKGVPSLFIETVLPQISSKIQKYADILTGGDVLVTLKAFTETQSKTVKEAIQISAVNTKGASVYGSNSAGERNRINLAVTLGLIDYFRSVGVFESSLLICDEIFDGLDSTGVEMALEAVEQSEIACVLVISHHEHFKPMFSNTQYVIKENGVSSLA